MMAVTRISTPLKDLPKTKATVADAVAKQKASEASASTTSTTTKTTTTAGPLGLAEAAASFLDVEEDEDSSNEGGTPKKGVGSGRQYGSCKGKIKDANGYYVWNRDIIISALPGTKVSLLERANSALRSVNRRE